MEKNLEQLIRASGLKVTTSRLKVLSEILSMRRPFSVADIYHQLHNSGKAVGLATVYRSLISFSEAGLVHKLAVQNGEAIFQATGNNSHSHVFCQQCGKIENIDDPDVERLKHEVSKNWSFGSGNYSLLLCVDCRQDKCPRKPTRM